MVAETFDRWSRVPSQPHVQSRLSENSPSDLTDPRQRLLSPSNYRSGHGCGERAGRCRRRRCNIGRPEPVTPFPMRQQALFGRHHRHECQIVIRREIDEIRSGQTDSVNSFEADGRHEETRSPSDRRIGL